ncbi:hypothetical protein SAMN02745702_00945 [Desulfobaculum bizertense DSM 18034]|uniref:Uncharacterized protein n=1 Tax=Desulfobaculum bizertense DSM 18034 TaxID=1121442 RepID=A0A1T4VT54_9BACT|nr:hypothetical protein SAMN02745702_00945 [Desulfobaculum bizertense DSM 18034]
MLLQCIHAAPSPRAFRLLPPPLGFFSSCPAILCTSSRPQLPRGTLFLNFGHKKSTPWVPALKESRGAEDLTGTPEKPRKESTFVESTMPIHFMRKCTQLCQAILDL